MIITVTLHCQGFQGPCSSAISTGLRDALGETPLNYLDGKLNVTVPRLMQSARNGQWDIRPVATDQGETWHARCPHCTQRLLDWTAQKVAETLAAHDTPPAASGTVIQFAVVGGLPLEVEKATASRHTCTTPTWTGHTNDPRTGETWRCERCGTLWAANQEDQSWTRMPK